MMYNTVAVGNEAYEQVPGHTLYLRLVGQPLHLTVFRPCVNQSSAQWIKGELSQNEKHRQANLDVDKSRKAGRGKQRYSIQ